MTAALIRPLIRRVPFRIVHLPLLARLQRTAYRPRKRGGRRFIGKPARKFYRFLRAVGLGGRGMFILEVDGAAHPFTFNSRNTQYSSLFVPPHDLGYEPEVCALIDLLLNDQGTFFDVGANWGYFCLYALSQRNFHGSVHAFEPFPPTFEDLDDIAHQSPFGIRFVTHRVALTDEDGTAPMTVADGLNSGLARLAATPIGNKVVRTACLDTMNLPRPDLIKIDVEGHEAAFMRGAQTTIAAARPHIIFESWREIQNTATTILPFRQLDQAGYVFFVPCWLEGMPPVPVHNGSKRGHVPGSAQFALVPFTTEQRFLLPDQINVLAVHTSRTGEIERAMDCSAES